MTAAVALIGIAVAGVPVFRPLLTFVHSLDATANARSVDFQFGGVTRTADASSVRAPIGTMQIRSENIVRQVLAIEAKQVALPDGDWTVGGAALTAGTSDGGPTGSVVSQVLLRLRGNVVDAIVPIQTNKSGTQVGWGMPTGCDRKDFYAASIRYASDHDGACSYDAFVDAVPRSANVVDPAWRETLQLAAVMGWRLPTQWFVAAYRIADPYDALEVRYFLTPSHAEPNEGGRVSGEGATAHPHALLRWSEAAWPAVSSGFRNRLQLGSAPAIPNWPSADRPSEQTADAHDVGGGLVAMQVGHAGLKTLTYRVFGSLTDFGVNYFYLGTAAAAGSLSVLGAVASSALYFVHELAWSYVDAPTRSVRDLPGIGIEQAGPRVG